MFFHKCGNIHLFFANNPKIALRLSTASLGYAHLDRKADPMPVASAAVRRRFNEDRAMMTNTLTEMARARRLRALNALEGPRRTRPYKTKLFRASGMDRDQLAYAA